MLNDGQRWFFDEKRWRHRLKRRQSRWTRRRRDQISNLKYSQSSYGEAYKWPSSHSPRHCNGLQRNLLYTASKSSFFLFQQRLSDLREINAKSKYASAHTLSSCWRSRKENIEELGKSGYIQGDNSSRGSCAPLIIPKTCKEGFHFWVVLSSIKTKLKLNKWLIPLAEPMLSWLSRS